MGPSLLPLAFHPATRDAYAAAHFVRGMAHDPGRRPFCLVYSCHEPHQPFVSPPPFDTAYAAGDMRLPETLGDAAAVALARARGHRLRPAEQWSTDDLRRMWAAYLGAVSYVDHLVGVVLEALLSTGAWDDTLFVFTSDHGEMLGSHGLLFKGEALFEELVNVPLLVVPPGGLAAPHATRGAWCRTSTWCRPSCAGAARRRRPGCPARTSGRWPRAATRRCARGWRWSTTPPTGGSVPCPLRGWRTEDWKYVELARGPEVRPPFDAPRWVTEGAELYDLRADPGETQNLVGDPGAAGARRRLRAALSDWLRATGDPWPEVALPRVFLPPRAGRPAGAAVPERRGPAPAGPG